MKRIRTAILICTCAAAALADDDEHLIVDAKIERQPVHLAFDTGTGAPFMIFSTTAQKLGLKVTPPSPDAKPGPGQVIFGTTGNCFMELGQSSFVTPLRVLDTPKYASLGEVDGIIGWPAIGHQIIFIDWSAASIKFLTNLPTGLDGWTQYHILTNEDDSGLALEVSDIRGTNEILAIDTGSESGAELSPSRWQVWKTNHLNHAFTLDAYYTPSIGLVAKEESWAASIALGSLMLTDVPVTEADSSSASLDSIPNACYEATLGLAALKRLDIIVDGIRGNAYLRPKKTPPSPYDHNRLGAVFLPKNPQTDNLVASVIPDSPASEAGIHDGDVLLKVGDIDCTQWRTNPSARPPINDPAGAKLYLTLSRNGKVFKTVATLRNIIPPDEPPNPK